MKPAAPVQSEENEEDFCYPVEEEKVLLKKVFGKKFAADRKRKLSNKNKFLAKSQKMYHLKPSSIFILKRFVPLYLADRPSSDSSKDLKSLKQTAGFFAWA